MNGEFRSAMRSERRLIAADWVLRIRVEELEEEVATEWLVWYESDPRNRDAFDEMVALWNNSEGLDRETLLAAGTMPQPSLVSRLQKLRTEAVALSLAASVALFLLPVLTVWNPLNRVEDSLPETAQIGTVTGEVRSARLQDGSQIDLGGRSAVSVRYTNRRRLVIAKNGEAFFDVTSNPDRPFVVRAGPLTITAVGTAFSVQREGDTVSVMVTEGLVEVRADPNHPAAAIEPATLRVAAGQRTRFDGGELIKSIEPRIVGAPDMVDRWRQGRLEFRDEPLRLVVARINRYSSTQITIGDREIEELRVTSTVYRDRVGAWLSGIEAVLPVRVSRTGEGNAVIRSATAD